MEHARRTEPHSSAVMANTCNVALSHRSLITPLSKLDAPSHLYSLETFDGCSAMARDTKAKQKRPWQDIAREAQEYRDASIARVQPGVPQLPTSLPQNVVDVPRNALSQQEVQITETAPEDLLSALASGELKATTVATAFLRRAGLAQKLVCSLRCTNSILLANTCM
jgi:hypothetical protein